MRKMKIDVTQKYSRVRILEPTEFIKGSIRTHDIGRPELSKRIAGRLKKTGKWKTQSFLISHKEPQKMKEKLFKEAMSIFVREHMKRGRRVHAYRRRRPRRLIK